jgi:hypothetical protein
MEAIYSSETRLLCLDITTQKIAHFITAVGTTNRGKKALFKFYTLALITLILEQNAILGYDGDS